MAFKDLEYLKEGYVLEITGIEQLNGKDAIKMNITDVDGNKSTEYYDKSNFLKLKEISSDKSRESFTREKDHFGESV